MSEIGEAFANSMAKSVEEFVQELKEMGINIPTPTTTNADRIRAMSNEELAEFLPDQKTECYHCSAGGIKCAVISCKGAWLDWLKQEVDI